MPRFGIQLEISSDNGSNFIQKTVKSVVQQLRIKQRLGCVYNSQSQQGMVEGWKSERTFKTKINNFSGSVN